MTGGLAEAQAVVKHRDGGTCVMCGVRMNEVHHRYRRGMGGSSDPEIHNPANLLCLCGAHHREAESLRLDVGEKLGLCVPSLAQAFTTPVRTHWLGWALPTAGGTWAPLAPGHRFSDAGQARSYAYLIGALTIPPSSV